jgi:hypothetical protein
MSAATTRCCAPNIFDLSCSHERPSNSPLLPAYIIPPPPMSNQRIISPAAIIRS